MAATPQQGTYLGTTLVGFTSLVAGLVMRAEHFALGWLIALIALAVLIYSGIGFYRIKNLAFTK